MSTTGNIVIGIVSFSVVCAIAIALISIGSRVATNEEMLMCLAEEACKNTANNPKH